MRSISVGVNACLLNVRRAAIDSVVIKHKFYTQ